MRLIQYLNESSKDTIVVDVQPMYQNFISFNISKFFDWLSEQPNILYLYNGVETVGEDNKKDIIEWMVLNYEFPEEKIDDVTFIDKGYGFFRSWMDMGVDEDTTIKIIKYMVKNDINDTRDIEELEDMLGDDYDADMESDSLIIPDIPINLLKKFNNSNIVGGGNNECLAEVMLFLDALNIRYNTVRRFVY